MMSVLLTEEDYLWYQKFLEHEIEKHFPTLNHILREFIAGSKEIPAEILKFLSAWEEKGLFDITSNRLSSLMIIKDYTQYDGFDQ